MSVRNKLAVSILTILATQYGGLAASTEICGPEAEINPDSTTWKVRLHGANKDRRAARKKRAKKLNRRR